MVTGGNGLVSRSLVHLKMLTVLGSYWHNSGFCLPRNALPRLLGDISSYTPCPKPPCPRYRFASSRKSSRESCAADTASCLNAANVQEADLLRCLPGPLQHTNDQGTVENPCSVGPPGCRSISGRGSGRSSRCKRLPSSGEGGFGPNIG